MARVPYLEPSDLAQEDQDLLKRPIALHKALVNSPKAARAFSVLGGYIRYGSKLDPRLRELAILQVGWLARSPYEWSHHVKLGHDFGVSDADVQGLIDDTDGKPTSLDPLSRLVLKGAREMTGRYVQFRIELPAICRAAGLDAIQKTRLDSCTQIVNAGAAPLHGEVGREQKDRQHVGS